MIEINNCHGCGQCVEWCPNDAIQYNITGHPEINRDVCQDCELCLEFDCPAEGFDIAMEFEND
jgi:ferredoxin